LDFQRQIELNNAYLSVVYFLLMYEVSHFLSHWRQKLIALILDTQFSGLLVFVISQSRNRLAITDALRVSQILADGFKSDRAYEVSPLFESIVSGYLLLNKKRYESARKDKSEVVKLQEEMYNKVTELEVQRDCCEREISDLKVSVDESSQSILTEQEQKKALREENTQLKTALHQHKMRIKKMTDQIKELEDANVALSQQIETIQRVAANSSVRQAGIRTKYNSLAQLEVFYDKAQDDIARLQETIKKLRAVGENDRRHIEALRQKIAKSRQAIGDLTAKNTELGRQLAAAEVDKAKITELCAKLEQKLRTVAQQRDQLQESDREGREKLHATTVELDRVAQERDERKAKADAKFKVLDSLESRLSALEDRNHEYQMLMRLIHRTTAPINQSQRQFNHF
jgi:chromosome segregation ATPase